MTNIISISCVLNVKSFRYLQGKIDTFNFIDESLEMLVFQGF